MDPEVSVVMTSYNHGQWVQQSIDSVLAQTFKNWELLVIDNGSTDNSPQIIEPYRRHPQITVIRYERNTPITAILNHGIRTARGRYFSLLYSDDYYLPTKLERQVAAFEALPSEYGVVYSTGYRLMPDGQLHLLPWGRHRGNVLHALLTEPQFFPPIAPLVLRECLLRYPFNESIFVEGEGVYAKIALGYLFHPLPEPLVVMRDHPGSMGKEIEANLRRDVLMYEHLFGRPDFPPALQHLRGIAIGGSYRLNGWQTMRRGRNYAQARTWLRRAIGHNRRALRNPRVIAGLVISSLPRVIADVCMDLLDRAAGVPPPPVSGPETPVEVRQPAVQSSAARDR
jgi:glycosyltransferase involved in cell wall biosynthesis